MTSPKESKEVSYDTYEGDFYKKITLESDVQNALRQEASKCGGILWRNNVGAYKTPQGYVRYGLCNDSMALNKKFKSADLIGIRPVVISERHLGTVIGQFWSIECKSTAWRVNPNDPTQQAQSRWLELVLQFGGAASINNTGHL